MRVLSVNVGLPRLVKVQGGTVLTSIFKSQVQGRVALRGYNLQGDRQSDLTVHGGPNKAVYLYPSEHYIYWAEQLPGMDLPFGVFGENLTTQGVSEERVHVGDQFQIGSAILQAVQPRMPCFKLGIRFGNEDMPKKFWLSGRPGIYFSVVEEGEIGSGDVIEQIAAGPEQVSIADVLRLYTGQITDRDLLRRALSLPLPGSWKEGIQERWEDALTINDAC